MKKNIIVKGDKVKVIAGNSRGKISTVISVSPTKGKAIVEGVNIITKHLKPTSSNPNGSIVKKEALIQLSNLMLVDPTSGNVTRVARKEVDGKTVRVSIKTGQQI